MPISNTTKLECDLVQNGKACGRVFLLPDAPEVPTPGSEHTVCLTIGLTAQHYYFCCMLHLIAFATAWELSSREAKKAPEPKKALTKEQFVMLKEMGIVVPDESRAYKSVEEIESLTQIPPPPENLSI